MKDKPPVDFTPTPQPPAHDIEYVLRRLAISYLAIYCSLDYALAMQLHEEELQEQQARQNRFAISLLFNRN